MKRYILCVETVERDEADEIVNFINVEAETDEEAVEKAIGVVSIDGRNWIATITKIEEMDEDEQ